MSVYFIRAGKNGPVKIGSAVDVQRRLEFLQTAHWEDLTLIREVTGDGKTERRFHWMFASHRIRREWFRFHPDMLIATPDEKTMDVPPAEEPKRDTTTDAQLIRDLGGMVFVARSLGINVSTVSNWGHPTRGIPWRMRLRVARLAEQRGITVPRDFLDHEAEAA